MSRDPRITRAIRTEQARPYPKGPLGENPDNAKVVQAGGGSTAQERNRALHDAAQAAGKRTQITRIENRIMELLALLHAGADVGDQLQRLRQWKADAEADLEQQP